MNAVTVAVGAVMLVALLYVKSYNRLVNERELVDDSWATLDAALGQRHELIPGLVSVVAAGEVDHPDLIEELRQARRVAADTEGMPGARTDPELDLAAATAAVLDLGMSSPALGNQRTFARVQHDLAEADDRIEAARLVYNRHVGELNRRVETFPSSIVAERHGIAAADYFAV